MGKNAIRLLQFCLKYPRGWHSMGTDRRDVYAMNTLEAYGLIEVIRYGRKARPQFRLSLPEDVRNVIQ